MLVVAIIFFVLIFENRVQSYNKKVKNKKKMGKKPYLCSMILEKLSLINYKNIPSATLELSPKINCLIGQNGVGKTNVLDAIFFLSFCHSAGNPIDSQVIRHGQDFLMIEGNYSDDLNIYCGMKRGTKKHFKRNKKEYKRLSEHIGLIPLVMVSPSDTITYTKNQELNLYLRKITM